MFEIRQGLRMVPELEFPMRCFLLVRRRFHGEANALEEHDGVTVKCYPAVVVGAAELGLATWPFGLKR